MARRDELIAGDAAWLDEAVQNGWHLPPKAPAALRLPGIRWMRFVFHSIRAHRQAAKWSSIGVGIGGPNEYDRWVIWAIYRGWC